METGGRDGGLPYGSAFLVEGSIYPAGTIDGPGFDPDSAAATGHWFCRGWIMARSDRSAPPVLTTQEYLLGVITADAPFPQDQLASSGVEPGAAGQSVQRSLIGGTGEFRGAVGTVMQNVTGTNTTVTPDGNPAPNFRFEFRFQ